MQTVQRLNNLLCHISNVRKACLIIAAQLLRRNQEQLAIRLIQASQFHDVSKFQGMEFEYLNDNQWPRPENDLRKAEFDRAVSLHVYNNSHHPEYWDGIHNMPELSVAEMVADWQARSWEQNTDLEEWIRAKATKRFGFSEKDPVFQVILKYVGMLKGEIPDVQVGLAISEAGPAGRLVEQRPLHSDRCGNC